MLTPPNEAVEFLRRYSADLSHECPVVHCKARRGEPCRNVPTGKVHESRRALRLGREANASRMQVPPPKQPT